MKTINKIEHKDELVSFIETVFDSANPMTSWQLVDGKRAIHNIEVKKLDIASDQLFYKTLSGEDCHFLEGIIFFYCPIKKVIFKSTLSEITGAEYCTNIPDEIKFLDESEEKNLSEMLEVFNAEIQFVKGHGEGNIHETTGIVKGSGEMNKYENTHMRLNTDDATEHITTKESGRNLSETHIETNLSHKTSTDKIDTTWKVKNMSAHDIDLFETELSFVTLDEEDKIFEGQRTAPRAKPPEGKMVTVQVADGSRSQSTHPLYDLSRGGLSFLVFSSTEFNKNEIIHVKSFDTKHLDAPMSLKVMSIREADSMGIQYKVGCMFDYSEE